MWEIDTLTWPDLKLTELMMNDELIELNRVFMGLWASTVYRCGYLYWQMWVELAWFDTVIRCCLLTGKSWESGHSRQAELEDRPSSCLSHSPPLATQPLFCSNTWYMQIRARREDHEVTANDKPSVVFDMWGAWIAICVGTEAHPKQKEIFPERSQPGRETWAEEETKPQEQQAGPDPLWGVETCNYTSQWKQLPLPLT